MGDFDILGKIANGNLFAHDAVYRKECMTISITLATGPTCVKSIVKVNQSVNLSWMVLHFLKQWRRREAYMKYTGDCQEDGHDI